MKRRLDLESQYWKLILSGVGTVEACRIVGIGRKTGYRWRAENGGVPPALVAEEARSDRYQALYNGGLSRTLTKRLRTGRPLRKRRRRADQRRSRFVAPAQLIEHRPPVVCTRTRVGDWEGDLIVGRGNQSAVATLVDRASRYLRLVHLPGNHNADTVRDALIANLGTLPHQVRLTLTWDQGAELAHHREIGVLLWEGVFFARPGSPWQRGTNENTNGLARQYLPKRTDLSIHTPQDLARIEHRLNTRPRAAANRALSL
jgi:IS30 family transposase